MPSYATPGISALSIGSILGGIGSVIGGIATGNPIGGLVGGIKTAFGSGGSPPPVVGVPNPYVPGSGGGLPGIGFGFPSGPGSTSGVSIGGPGGLVIGNATTGTPRGYHVGKNGKLVKNRHMNAGNARALRRAIRREDAFVKLAKRSLRHTAYAITRRGAHHARRPARETITVRG